MSVPNPEGVGEGDGEKSLSNTNTALGEVRSLVEMMYETYVSIEMARRADPSFWLMRLSTKRSEVCKVKLTDAPKIL